MPCTHLGSSSRPQLPNCTPYLRIMSSLSGSVIKSGSCPSEKLGPYQHPRDTRIRLNTAVSTSEVERRQAGWIHPLPGIITFWPPLRVAKLGIHLGEVWRGGGEEAQDLPAPMTPKQWLHQTPRLIFTTRNTSTLWSFMTTLES